MAAQSAQPPHDPAADWGAPADPYRPSAAEALANLRQKHVRRPAIPNRPWSPRTTEPRLPKPGWGGLIFFMIPVSWHLFWVLGMLAGASGMGDGAMVLAFFLTPFLAGAMALELRHGATALRFVLLLLGIVLNGLGALVYGLLLLLCMAFDAAPIAVFLLLFIVIDIAATFVGIYHHNQMNQFQLGPRQQNVPKPKPLPPDPELDISGDWDQAKPRAVGRV